ncbi:hypothetical protein DNFV4_02297 [Nitrospira tepida]|uniref:Uncharacterized protein n=2 Tax=Nitrospira tepida TaxID=2973512 RepID=A0AA86T536_9BACT|nr:hypothetical protein DNFV4_02297 [Nitrospira tepida]
MPKAIHGKVRMGLKSVLLLISLLSFQAWLGAACAGEFSGTWRGLLQAEGEGAEAEVLFSRDDHPVYTYTNNRNVTRQVELASPGQVIEFVPPGGGVQRIIVEHVDRQPGKLLISLKGSFEKSGGGYLDQQQEVVVFEYELVPEGLKMRIRRRTVSHFGDKDMIVGGQPQEAVAEGLLQRAQ